MMPNAIQNDNLLVRNRRFETLLLRGFFI